MYDGAFDLHKGGVIGRRAGRPVEAQAVGQTVPNDTFTCSRWKACRSSVRASATECQSDRPSCEPRQRVGPTFASLPFVRMLAQRSENCPCFMRSTPLYFAPSPWDNHLVTQPRCA